MVENIQQNIQQDQDIMDQELYCAKNAPELLEYLLKRRSAPIATIAEPGPDRAQIETMLRAASRVPDHGKMFPWYFIVFEGDTRKKVGDAIAKAYQEENGDTAQAKLDLEAGRFMRAPLVIGVISRIRKGKNPMWEQILSAGAACQNLCLAANSLGFATNWLTEWYSYNENVRNAIGLDERDHVAGFIYIGTPDKQPEERDRPELSTIVTYWDEGKPLNKGDNYDREQFDWPVTGIDLSKVG